MRSLVSEQKKRNDINDPVPILDREILLNN